MKRYYFPELESVDLSAVITGDEFLHMQVMREKVGNSVVLFDGKGLQAEAKIVNIAKKQVEVKVLNKKQVPFHASAKVTLFTANIKGERQDILIRQAIELGVFDVALFSCARAEAKPSGNKIERLSRLAVSSCKQCGRAYLPALFNLSFNEVIKKLSGYDLVIFANESEKTRAIVEFEAEIKKAETIAVVIGPEGGFDEQESAAMLKLANVVSVSLGELILRADTAATAVISFVSFLKM